MAALPGGGMSQERKVDLGCFGGMLIIMLLTIEGVLVAISVGLSRIADALEIIANAQ